MRKSFRFGFYSPYKAKHLTVKLEVPYATWLTHVVSQISKQGYRYDPSNSSFDCPWHLITENEGPRITIAMKETSGGEGFDHDSSTSTPPPPSLTPSLPSSPAFFTFEVGTRVTSRVLKVYNDRFKDPIAASGTILGNECALHWHTCIDENTGRSLPQQWCVCFGFHSSANARDLVAELEDPINGEYHTVHQITKFFVSLQDNGLMSFYCPLAWIVGCHNPRITIETKRSPETQYHSPFSFPVVVFSLSIFKWDAPEESASVVLY